MVVITAYRQWLMHHTADLDHFSSLTLALVTIYFGFVWDLLVGNLVRLTLDTNCRCLTQNLLSFFGL